MTFRTKEDCQSYSRFINNKNNILKNYWLVTWMSIPSKVVKIFGLEQQQKLDKGVNYGNEHKDKSC